MALVTTFYYLSSMITYMGAFNLMFMIEECRKVVGMHLNKNNVDESEVPFENLSTGEVKYMQFVRLLDRWVYVGIRK